MTQKAQKDHSSSFDKGGTAANLDEDRQNAGAVDRRSMSLPQSLVVGECWMKSKFEVGTFQHASSEAWSNSDLIVEEHAVNVDRESIDYGCAGLPDFHTTSIVEELTN
jgi:hypothetical protein